MKEPLLDYEKKLTLRKTLTVKQTLSRQDSVIPPRLRTLTVKINARKTYVGEIIAPFFTCFVIYTFIISIPVVLFHGPLEQYLISAMHSGMVGTFVNQLIISFWGPYPSAVNQMSIESTPLLSEIVSDLEKSTYPLEHQAATLLFIISLEAILSGIIAFILGKLKMAKILHYLPTPVTSGAFGAVGYFLYKYCYTIGYGEEFSSNIFKNYSVWLFVIIHLGGLLLFVLQNYFSSPFNFPGFLIIGSVIFHICRFIFHISLEEAQNSTWLMKPPESEPFYNLYVRMNPNLIEFKFVLQETATIFLACLLGPILNTGINALVLDRMFGKSSSLDSLFTNLSYGNFFSGLLGGFPSNIAISATGFHRVCGGSYKWSTIELSVIIMLSFFIPQVISVVILIPRFLLGAVFVYMGIDFIVSSLKAYYEVTKLEFCIILAIIIGSALLGITTGLGAGIFISFVMYIYSSAHTQFISSESNDYSNYTLEDEVEFKNENQSIKIYQLSGYIFFAPSYDISEHILDTVKKQNIQLGSSFITFVVIDFSRVTGLDSTAKNVLADLVVDLAEDNIHVGLVFVNPKRREEMFNYLKTKYPNTDVYPFSTYSTIQDAIDEYTYHMTFCNSSNFQNKEIIKFRNKHLQTIYYFINSLLYTNNNSLVRKAILRIFSDNLGGKIIRFEKNEIIFKENSTSQGIYILLKGKILVYSDLLNYDDPSSFDPDKLLWTITRKGAIIGNVDEYGDVVCNNETTVVSNEIVKNEKGNGGGIPLSNSIDDGSCLMFFISHESLKKLKEVDVNLSHAIYKWERKIRIKKLDMLKKRLISATKAFLEN